MHNSFYVKSISFTYFQFGCVNQNEHLTLCSCLVLCISVYSRNFWNNQTISHLCINPNYSGNSIFDGKSCELSQRSLRPRQSFSTQMDSKLVSIDFFPVKLKISTNFTYFPLSGDLCQNGYLSTKDFILYF